MLRRAVREGAVVFLGWEVHFLAFAATAMSRLVEWGMSPWMIGPVSGEPLHPKYGEYAAIQIIQALFTAGIACFSLGGALPPPRVYLRSLPGFLSVAAASSLAMLILQAAFRDGRDLLQLVFLQVVLGGVALLALARHAARRTGRTVPSFGSALWPGLPVWIAWTLLIHFWSSNPGILHAKWSGGIDLLPVVPAKETTVLLHGFVFHLLLAAPIVLLARWVVPSEDADREGVTDLPGP